MVEKSNRLDEIAHQINENVLAVKGTLELVDTSVTEEELHDLLLKAVERMDIIQGLTADVLGVLKNCLERISAGGK